MDGAAKGTQCCRYVDSLYGCLEGVVSESSQIVRIVDMYGPDMPPITFTSDHNSTISIWSSLLTQTAATKFSIQGGGQVLDNSLANRYCALVTDCPFNGCAEVRYSPSAKTLYREKHNNAIPLLDRTQFLGYIMIRAGVISDALALEWPPSI